MAGDQSPRCCPICENMPRPDDPDGDSQLRPHPSWLTHRSISSMPWRMSANGLYDCRSHAPDDGMSRRGCAEDVDRLTGWSVPDRSPLWRVSVAMCSSLGAV